MGAAASPYCRAETHHQVPCMAEYVVTAERKMEIITRDTGSIESE